MQALRNKLHHGKSKRSDEKRRSVEEQQFTAAPVNSMPSAPDAVVTSFSESHEDHMGSHVDRYEKTEVMPSSSMTSSMSSSMEVDSSIPTPLPTVFPTESVRTMEVMPTEIIEKPVIIHESIRQEQIEEIQPVVRVEREKTEIRQIVQPLTDKEIRPVMIEERTLDVEVLPTIVNDSKSMPGEIDFSTRDFDATLRQVVEKAPIVQETEKWRVIEEVQPIIYREIIVPHVIRTNKPMREVIVEAPIFSEQVLVQRELTAAERQRWSSYFSQKSVAREVIPSASIPVTSIVEPTEIRVASVAAPLHGRKEIIEEITTTTTTTTAAPTVSSRSMSSSSQPGVLSQTHDVKLGPHGETITRDVTTVIQPTRAL